MIGCFIGVIVLALAHEERAPSHVIESRGGTHETKGPFDISHVLNQAKKNHDNLTFRGYLVGLACVICTAWCYSTVGVLTNYLNNIHFSVMLFHYAWSASTILIIYLCFDYLKSDSVVPRLFTYNMQLYGLTLAASLLNAFGMNLATIAW